jgi:hypothetical protein
MKIAASIVVMVPEAGLWFYCSTALVYSNNKKCKKKKKC